MVPEEHTIQRTSLPLAEVERLVEKGFIEDECSLSREVNGHFLSSVKRERIAASEALR